MAYRYQCGCRLKARAVRRALKYMKEGMTLREACVQSWKYYREVNPVYIEEIINNVEVRDR